MKRRGFTLIELLIVMTIIVVLSSLTLISFSGYRQAAVLKLTSESVTSSIAEAKLKVSQGKKGLLKNGETGAVCFGVLMKEGESGVTILQWPYDAKDFYDPSEKNILKTGQCKDLDVNDANVLKEFKPFQEKVTFSKLIALNKEQKSLYVIFEPPQGNIISSLGKDADKVTVTLAGASGSGAERSFELDLKTGNIL